MPDSVLLVGDKATFADDITTYLQQHNYRIHLANHTREARRLLKTYQPGMILLDLHLPDDSGPDALSMLLQCAPRAKVIVMTAATYPQTAAELMRAGACGHLSKPLVLEHLIHLLAQVSSRHQPLPNAPGMDQTNSNGQVEMLLGTSAAMRAFKSQLQQLINAEQDLPGANLPSVLITGETGTGKELVARRLHETGQRKEQALIELNCASIPAQLLEAELFGYEPGAFTDARDRKTGLFEAAHGGTLFLDEIGDLEIALQAKLLKVIEDKTIRRLGGVHQRPIDTRIIAATNQPLERWVQQGKFRSDLFFRLRVIHLTLPPLRERDQDILLLAHHFLQLYGRRYGKLNIRFSAAAEKALLQYLWPGNVRELRNAVEQTVLLCQSAVIQPAQLPLLPESSWGTAGAYDSPERFILPPQGVSLTGLERDLVRQALERSAGNVTQAAKLLGLSRDTLRYRIEKYQVHNPTRR
ncbi:MAG: sigma-54 dependent transcriptional regulator [Candidatus Tectomicrobia bacterium]|nr:sigma-54 dependent transcriptional regulator [Candidatus Tectomicrobia bacterium]